MPGSEEQKLMENYMLSHQQLPKLLKLKAMKPIFATYHNKLLS